MGRSIDDIFEQIRQENQEAERLRDLRLQRFRDRANLADDLEQVKRIIHRKKERSRALRDDELFPKWSDEWVAEAREQIADDVERMEAHADELVEAIEVKSNLLQKVQNRLGRNRKRVARLRRIAKAKRKRRGALSEHFVLEEMACRDGTPAPECVHDDLKVHCERVLGSS